MQNVNPDKQTDRQKILERIRKLLALGTSSNQAEAELAMQRAEELLKRHQIDEAELDRGKIEAFSHYIKRKRVPKWQVSLMNVIAKNNFVLFVWDGNYPTLLTEEDYDDLAVPLRLIGRESNVQTTSMMHSYLVDAANRSVKAYCRDNGKSAKRSYLYGFVMGVRDKLEETKKSWSSEEKTALVRIENQDKADINKYLEETGQKLRMSNSRVRHTVHTLKGIRDGKAVSLSRQMSGQQKMLTGG
jgi:uncharacterized protein YoaH (UPF0181 family)